MNEQEEGELRILDAVVEEAHEEWIGYLAQRGLMPPDDPSPDDGPPVPSRGRGRRPGRPRWPEGLFRERLNEAREATGPPFRADDVAANFRMLNGTQGMGVRQFRRLCARFNVSADLE